jgi:hypothetical protein
MEMMLYFLHRPLATPGWELETLLRLINLSAHQDCSDNALRHLQNSTIDEESPGSREPIGKPHRFAGATQAPLFQRRPDGFHTLT